MKLGVREGSLEGKKGNIREDWSEINEKRNEKHEVKTRWENWMERPGEGAGGIAGRWAEGGGKQGGRQKGKRSQGEKPRKGRGRQRGTLRNSRAGKT